MTTQPVVRACATCKFFAYSPVGLSQDPEGNPLQIGTCRKRPPSGHGFPAVSERLWCGEHRTAPAFLPAA